MLLLAGLMGMVLVGATVFVGMEDDVTDDMSSDADNWDQNGSGHQQDDILNSLTETNDADATGADDPVHSGGGDAGDVIAGAGGDDVLHGGAGDDSLDGQDGADTLHGDAGDDMLSGGAGDDALFGHIGNDLIEGGDGDDKAEAGDGADTVLGGAGDDALSGYLGDDHLDGGAGQDTLFGGWGNDLLNGAEDDAAAADFLNGGGGDDAIHAGLGDIITAGDGADTVGLSVGADGAEAQMLDFDSEEDTLIVLFDDSNGGTDPVVSVEIDADDPDLAHVLLDGARVMAVSGAPDLTASDIQLMSEATASGLWN